MFLDTPGTAGITISMVLSQANLFSRTATTATFVSITFSVTRHHCLFSLKN